MSTDKLLEPESSALLTLLAGRQGLERALAYFDATNSDDVRRVRVALAGIAAACDSFKATVNAYSNVVAHVSRAPGRES